MHARLVNAPLLLNLSFGFLWFRLSLGIVTNGRVNIFVHGLDLNNQHPHTIVIHILLNKFNCFYGAALFKTIVVSVLGVSVLGVC